MDTRGIVRKRECANSHRFFTQETYLGLSNTLLPPKTPKVKRKLDESRVLRVLDKHNGNKYAAAQEMGVPYSTFRGWITAIKEKSNETEGVQRGV